MAGRFASLGLLLLGCYAFLLFHLYQIQVAKSGYYSAKAESQYAALMADAERRGTIYFTDKDGNKLPAAMPKSFPVVYAVPNVIADPSALAKQTAEILNVPSGQLLQSFSKKSSYVILDKNPSAEEVLKVKAAAVKGLYTEDAPRRFYPFGNLASQVVGFVSPNADDNGQSGKYGAEKMYEDTLRGDGLDSYGADVALTVDPSVETEAEQVIRELAAQFGAKRASVMVADPATGKIVAMGSTPAFDPNKYASSSLKNFRNPLVEDIYEPGSVFKVLTMVAAIDTGKLSPNSTYLDTGTLTLNGKTIKNWDLRAHGTVTMTEVIEGSINTGAAYAAKKAGSDTLRGYFENFGFGKKTGITLPGELPGSLATFKSGAPEINFATASFGQGVSATGLQVLQALASIANGGVLMRPYLDANLGPMEIRRVMKADTARKVTDMMVAAVDTAKVAKIKGYAVAGKTGTAQVPDFVHGGYTDNVIDTYVGFAPASNPRFIALIRLEEPAGAPHAAETVVPAFKRLAEWLLNYYNVPPDRAEK
jgi:cell division protein FtsI/penicillin-binding protein 2